MLWSMTSVVTFMMFSLKSRTKSTTFEIFARFLFCWKVWHSEQLQVSDIIIYHEGNKNKKRRRKADCLKTTITDNWFKRTSRVFQITKGHYYWLSQWIAKGTSTCSTGYSTWARWCSMIPTALLMLSSICSFGVDSHCTCQKVMLVSPQVERKWLSAI